MPCNLVMVTGSLWLWLQVHMYRTRLTYKRCIEKGAMVGNIEDLFEDLKLDELHIMKFVIDKFVGR